MSNTKGSSKKAPMDDLQSIIEQTKTVAGPQGKQRKPAVVVKNTNLGFLVGLSNQISKKKKPEEILAWALTELKNKTGAENALIVSLEDSTIKVRSSAMAIMPFEANLVVQYMSDPVLAQKEQILFSAKKAYCVQRIVKASVSPSLLVIKASPQQGFTDKDTTLVQTVGPKLSKLVKP